MEFAVKGAFAIAVVVGIAALWTLPVKWLWNDLAPTLFGLKVITFWQALKLSLLCSIGPWK